MATWTNPDSVHRATAGAVAPYTWGDTVNDDLNFLAGSQSAAVQTSQTTASTSYTDLTTVGPAVTVTTGANAIVIVNFIGSNGTSADGAIMSAAVSGATTLSASDSNAAQVNGSTNISAACISMITGLTPGSNTFTAKYRAGTGGTATFIRRTITVIPLP